MAKKKDPFEDFAEKMLSGPKVSEAAPAADKSAEAAEPAREAAVPAASASPVVESAPVKKSLHDDHKPFTVFLRNDILLKLKTASFKSGLSGKAIINQALEEFFEKHKGML